MESKLTKHQVGAYGPVQWRDREVIKAEVRYDDRRGNGHNTFSITGEIYVPGQRDCEACGCLHNEIRQALPELAPYIKWHLVSSDGPLHYLENTLYWLGYSGWCGDKKGSPPNLEHSRSVAIWSDMPEEMLAKSGRYTRAEVIKILVDRLPELMAEFKMAVESLGFTF